MAASKPAGSALFTSLASQRFKSVSRECEQAASPRNAGKMDLRDAESCEGSVVDSKAYTRSFSKDSAHDVGSFRDKKSDFLRYAGHVDTTETHYEQRTMLGRDRLEKLGVYPAEASGRAAAPAGHYDRQDTTTADSHGVDDVRETSSLPYDPMTSRFLKSSARDKQPDGAPSFLRRLDTSRFANKTVGAMDAHTGRRVPSCGRASGATAEDIYPSSSSSSCSSRSSPQSSCPSSSAATYDKAFAESSPNDACSTVQPPTAGRRGVDCPNNEVLPPSFCRPSSDMGGRHEKHSTTNPVQHTAIEMSPVQRSSTHRPQFANVVPSYSLTPPVPKNDDVVEAGHLVSMYLPEPRLFLVMIPPVLNDLRAFPLPPSSPPSDFPPASFSAGLSKFHLTPCCERLHETSYPLVTFPKESSKDADVDACQQNVYVTSPQHVLILPVTRLLDNIRKKTEKNWTTEHHLTRESRTTLSEGDTDPSCVVRTNTPCFLCLPVHLARDHQPQAVASSAPAVPSSRHQEAVPSTTSVLCLLRARAPRCAQDSSRGQGDGHYCTSDDVEFRPTDLTGFIQTYEREARKRSPNPMATPYPPESGTRNSPGKVHRQGHRKPSESPAACMLQALRQHHDLSDAVWTLERVDASPGHLAKTTAEPVEFRSARYFFRSFRNEYLAVDHEAAPQTAASSLPSRALAYRLVLRQTLDPTREMDSAGWLLNQSFRPFEPLWVEACPRLLLSPNSSLELSSPVNLFHTLPHLKSPFQSLPCELPLYIQEMLLVEDLMYCFLGVPGEIIKFRYMEDEVALPTAAGAFLMHNHTKAAGPNKILFSLPSDPVELYFAVAEPIEGRIALDPSLLQMVKRILSVCRIHRKLCRFVELHWDIRFGLCSQALAHAMKTMLTEFQVRITQLESAHQDGQLSLQKFWFHLQPATASFQTLEKIVDAVRGRRGGELLNGLSRVWQSISRTDAAKQLCRFLLDRSAAPLTAILADWLTKGVINDPHDEFWITDDVTISPWSHEIVSRDPQAAPAGGVPAGPADADVDTFGAHPYWYLKFRVKQHACVPDFLASVTTKALDAGKHLSVLTSCPRYQHTVNAHRAHKPASVLESSISPLDRRYAQAIIDSSHYAASCLLSNLTQQCDLAGRLASIRRFMFFARSDMIFSLLSSIEEEVRTHPVTKVVGRLDVLLDSAVSASSLVNDPYRTTFHCTLSHYNTREVSPWFNRTLRELDSAAADTVTHAMLSLASGLALRQPAGHDGVGFPLFGGTSLAATAAGPERYQQAPAMERHPLLRSATTVYRDPLQYSFSLDSISSSTQTSSIQKFQELLKYLTLSFEFSWPLSLIFTRATIIKYQLLSRLVMQLKFTEKKLTEIWQTQMRWCPRGGRRSPRTTQHHFLLSDMLRLRMLHFVRNFIFYITIEVLEPRFHQFFYSLTEAHSLDDVINLHEHFLNKCLNETLLTEPNMIRNLSKILTVCHLYTSSAIKFSLYRMERSYGTARPPPPGAANRADPRHLLGRKNEPFCAPPCSMSEEQFGSLVKQYANHFERNLKNFLILLLERNTSNTKCNNSHVYNLLTRLDFNGYYSKIFQLNLYSVDREDAQWE